MKKGIIVWLMISLLWMGCTNNGGSSMTTVEQQMELKTINFQYSHGSMQGYDYSFYVKKNELVYADFYLDYKYYSVEMVALTNEQWQEISALLMDVLETTHSYEETKKKDDGIFALDEGSQSFRLTWNDVDGSEKKLSYVYPAGEAFETFKDYLISIAMESLNS